MRCIKCSRNTFTTLNINQNNRLCKKKCKKVLPLTKKNLMLWTENNIEKWYENIYDADTEEEIKIYTTINRSENIVIKKLENLKF